MDSGNISKYAQLASKAVKSPEKATYKIKEFIGSIPAGIHSNWKTKDLAGQGERVRLLRQEEEYLLIVLDACRYDFFKNIAPEYLTFDSIEPVRSEGRNTFEYVSRCWSGEYEDVEYISAATPVNSDSRSEYDQDTLSQLYGGYVPSEHISNIRDVWRESWDESIGITPPKAVTDAALETDKNRLVAHYFQPHAPFIGRQSLLGHTNDESSRPWEGEPVDVPVWQQVKFGDLTQEELRAVYESNLHRALREVRRLVIETEIENIVIMGDHGEALGEYWAYEHPRIEHPYIRTVPWAVVKGVCDYPDSSDQGESDSSVTSRLEDLGYLS
ncbi:alkaline phosphatase family protein [Haladaptatus caseinilyticus]|uniref:hypothetical protein n=1 Tax=Haladaptatus caseinilyticus TaxID=2993314 RepID=UPI00224B1762|nr:hypothetical protein [Haladaptatus caseinilyticus]